jgi:aldehyde dehydrogenase (NAD+)
VSKNVDGEFRMLIDGLLRPARSGDTYGNVSPSTEETLGLTSDAGLSDLGDAIAAARTAADAEEWARDKEFRIHCMRQLHQALRENEDQFREVDTAEAGRPYARTAASIGRNIVELERWIELAGRYEFDQPHPDGSGLLRREPFGVVGAILTWNCGFALNIKKCAPALASGNTIVVRPAPETPWQTTLFGRLIAQRTDIPPGVVNIVPSSNPDVAAALTEDPRVDMVTFTGSTGIARRIMAQAAGTLKKVHLEAGGKSAAVLLDDADFESVIPGIVTRLCANAGQTCAALTRLLLPRSRYAEGIELAREALSKVSCGDPWDEACGQGPQISSRHRDRVLAYFKKAQDEGAKVVLGGGRPALPRGFYVEPSLFADVEPCSTIAQEEIFGPALAAIAYGSDADALAIANNSIYGLYGAVYSESDDRAMDIARGIKAGQVSVNGGDTFDLGPFGGYKQSGLGREGGVWGLEEYLEIKTIGVPQR